MCMDILFMNQQTLFTMIDKDIRFCVLFLLTNKTKEDWYGALDVVMIHYNKEGFSVIRIECDCEFQYIMDEVINEMRIEMNYANSDNHFPEAERNNTVIKERFLIVYYQFLYKEIPRTIIHRLVMNVTQNLNLFLAKDVGLAHYSPHRILSQTNWHY